MSISGRALIFGTATRFRLGIDADGSGAGSRDPGSAFVGPNDASITFALTREGARAWAHYHGNPRRRGAIQDMDMHIVRDDDMQQTRYSLYFNWSDFQMKPGIAETMGFAVQVNDMDEGSQQLRLYWGDGAGGNLRPGLFKTVRLDTPDEEFVSILPSKTNLWSADDSMQIFIAAYTFQPLDLTVSRGFEEPRFFSIDPDTGSVQRYVLTLKPHVYYSRQTFEIRAESDGYTLDRETFVPAYPAVTIEDLLAELQQILSGDSDSLTARHFQSVYDVVTAEWQKAQSRLREGESEALLCAAYSDYLFREVKNELNAADKIRSGSKHMLCTFTASDNSLQFYKLLLPRDWTPERRYPVIVDLHGAGNPYPLSFFTSVPGAIRGSEEMNENNVQAFILQPWCRGNAGYRGEAGRDIYEALHDMQANWNSADSVYLTGFSMGGYGAWMHMLRSPEQWRAVVIAAGGPSDSVSEQQLSAVKDLPVMIWHGDSDGAVSVSNAYEMQHMLESAGGQPVMKILSGRGHLMTADERAGIYRWLLQH
ncbi:MAG: dienelactone hydrolase family protein [candidate division KSB1 bacterium]|nr:dienelactone hydrolase family protein [candidate division KSB1 bacterium]